MIRDFRYWRGITAHAVVLHGVPCGEALGDAVAQACVFAETIGLKPSVWHSLSMVTGNPCHCFDCEPIGEPL